MSWRPSSCGRSHATDPTSATLPAGREPAPVTGDPPDTGAGGHGQGAATTEYVLLLAPSANRVYADQAPRLAQAELTAFGDRVLDAGLHGVAPLRLGGVPYVGVRTVGPFSDRDVAHLSNVSSGYALFARTGELLRPVTLTPMACFDDDLITIPKYAGKTNEQFTRLLLNLTVLASSRAHELAGVSVGRRRLTVLDPLCGRGTTLNQALMYGYDAIGVETDGRHVDAYAAFLRTWLRRKRLKHTVEMTQVRRERKRIARRLAVTLAPTREAYRDGDTQQVTVFHGDTLKARELLKAGCCDVIVADAPYGVAHGSRTPEWSGPSRSPRDLLAAALDGWVALLRRGGALGLSFNALVTPREEVEALLAGAGLSVVTSPGYVGLAHRVDQGITRDVVVARVEPT
jgi:SAM-dependent methyltransferase